MAEPPLLTVLAVRWYFRLSRRGYMMLTRLEGFEAEFARKFADKIEDTVTRQLDEEIEGLEHEEP